MWFEKRLCYARFRCSNYPRVRSRRKRQFSRTRPSDCALLPAFRDPNSCALELDLASQPVVNGVDDTSSEFPPFPAQNRVEARVGIERRRAPDPTASHSISIERIAWFYGRFQAFFVVRSMFFHRSVNARSMPFRWRIRWNFGEGILL